MSRDTRPAFAATLTGRPQYAVFETIDATALAWEEIDVRERPGPLSGRQSRPDPFSRQAPNWAWQIPPLAGGKEAGDVSLANPVPGRIASVSMECDERLQAK